MRVCTCVYTCVFYVSIYVEYGLYTMLMDNDVYTNSLSSSLSLCVCLGVETLNTLVKAEDHDLSTVITSSESQENLHILLNALQTQFSNFQPSYQANILLSLAKLTDLFGELQLEPLFQDFAEALLKNGGKLSEFQAIELTNIFWSYAKLNYHHERLFERLSSELLKRDINSFQPQDISNVLWSFSTLNIRNQNQICEAMAGVFVKSDLKQTLFTKQDMANTIWAFAKLKLTKHKLAFDDFIPPS